LGIKNKKLKVGDLVRIRGNTHWDYEVSNPISRDGIIIGPGPYHESYMILFTHDGKIRQFHKTFIKFLSSINGEKITFNKNI
jgi:hypothetical protein